MNKVVIILLALTALMMVGCDSTNESILQSGDILTIDSCQYVVCYYGGYKGFIHHNNCRFCKERNSIKWEKRKKELEELVIKLKEK